MAQTGERRAAFSAAIERELKSGELVFPTSMQAALKIRRALDDQSSGLTNVARVIALEPLLSVKLLRMANSTYFNPRDLPVSDVQRALLRVGVENARLLAIMVIGEQLASAQEFAPVRPLADQLWRHSLDVASLCYAIAIQVDSVRPDTALLAGMVHAIGQFYLLARSHAFPELLEDRGEFADIILFWDKRVSQSVLYALGTPDEIVEAVAESETVVPAWPPTRLVDMLHLARLATSTPNPFSTQPFEQQIADRQAALAAMDGGPLGRMLDEARIRRAAALAMLTA